MPRAYSSARRAVRSSVRGKRLRHFRGEIAQRHEAARRHQPRQIGAHRAHRRRDRHVVVVQDHDQAGLHRPGIVHRLIGHAGAHRAVADHGDHIARVLLLLEVARHRHAEAGGDRGAGMRRAERVVFALGAAGEAGEAAGLAQRADPVAPAGEDFMRIGLVADIPDQPVARRVEHRMDGDGQLDHAERGAQMPAGDRDGIDGLRAQLFGQLLQLLVGEILQIGRIRDPVQKRRPRRH